MLTRRHLVSALAAAPALAVGAAQAITSESASKALDALLDTHAVKLPRGAADMLIRNVMASHQDSPETLKLVLTLNVRLLADHPDLYDPSLYMDGPVALLHGRTVEARTRKLAGSASMLVEGTKIPGGPAGAHLGDGMFYRILTEDFAAEVRQERKLLKAEGKDICAYMPVSSSRLVFHPTSLAPMITFQTRYGIWDGSGAAPVA